MSSDLSKTVLKYPNGSSVALGFFDGVHLGHRKIIEKAVSTAETEGVSAGVWMPGNVDNFKGASGFICTEEEKKSELFSLGVNYIAVSDFEEIRNYSGQRFVEEILKEQLNASTVVCGYNFTFGKGAVLGSEDLAEICRKAGIGCVILDKVVVDGTDVSSSLIREKILCGDVKSAGVFLGRPFSFTQIVIHGKRLGRTLGFPTINQLIPEGIVRPANGVYLSKVLFEDGGRECSFFGATNIGDCPTITKEILEESNISVKTLSNEGSAKRNHPVSETFILDYGGDLYGKTVKIQLLDMIRKECRFGSKEELLEQITKDTNAVRKLVFDGKMQ